MFLEHVDLRLCQHATIADQYHVRQAEPLRERLHLVGDGLGIPGVAGIDPHGDGPTVGVGERAVDDDREPGLAVAIVPEAGQRAGLALVVTAGDVVEHQRPVSQVSLGQLLLDRRLALQQPVHRVVELILVGIGDVQLLGQSGVMPVSGVGQFGAGKHQSFDDHGDNQIAPPGRLGGDDLIEAELTDHLQDGLDMPVRQRASDLEGFGGGNERLALERAFDDLDKVIGEMGEVAEGLVGDGLSLADGTPEQMGDVGLTFVDPFGRGHMDGAASCCHAAIFRTTAAMSRPGNHF
jgi:hypothetical protein